MKQYSLIFFWGMVISFLGSLPPGTMNIAATQIASHQGKESAFIYSIGSMLAEVLIVRTALSGMKQIIRRHRLFHILELLTALLLLGMAITCFVATTDIRSVNSILPNYQLPPFKTGVLLSIVNPMHIPFWLAWTSVLMSKNILSPLPKHYNCYILGIAIGTISGFITFIYLGAYLLDIFERNQFIIFPLTGLVLLIGFLIHIRKMIQSPVSVRYTKLINQYSIK